MFFSKSTKHSFLGTYTLPTYVLAAQNVELKHGYDVYMPSMYVYIIYVLFPVRAAQPSVDTEWDPRIL